MTSPPSTPGSGPFSPGAGLQATLPPRLATGVAGLDTILQGGFFRHGIYLIAGAPGTGKTILGNQIAVHHAATGGRVVYISLLSESFTRMFGHLSSLAFFQEPAIQPLIGDALYYISGYGVLQTDGLKGLLALLHGALRDHRATLLILDSILSIEAFATSGLAFKEFIHSLQQYAEIYGSTGLLLSSRDGRAGEGDRADVQTTVDGLFHLTRRRVGVRVVREVEVVKFRGSGYLPGAHVLDISGAGVTVYPRTEALLAVPAGMDSLVAASRERVAFGIAELDAMLDGGVRRGSMTALFGPPGSGKTMLGMHYLAEGIRQGEPGLYFGHNEPPSVLIDVGDQVALSFTRLVEAGQVEIAWHPATEAELDILAQDLLRRVHDRHARRVFIDGLDVFSHSTLYAERFAPFLTALAHELRALGVTTLVSLESRSLFGPSVEMPIEGVSSVVENILFLRYVELRSHLYRLISVLKTRRSRHDPALRQFTIDERGITIASTFESAEAILTGLARPLPEQPAVTKESISLRRPTDEM